MGGETFINITCYSKFMDRISSAEERLRNCLAEPYIDRDFESKTFVYSWNRLISTRFPESFHVLCQATALNGIEVKRLTYRRVGAGAISASDGQWPTVRIRGPRPQR